MNGRKSIRNLSTRTGCFEGFGVGGVKAASFTCNKEEYGKRINLGQSNIKFLVFSKLSNLTLSAKTTPSISKYSGLFGNRTIPDKRKISPESEKNGDYFEIHISGVNCNFEICDVIGQNSKLSSPIGRPSLVERDDRLKKSTIF